MRWSALSGRQNKTQCHVPALISVPNQETLPRNAGEAKISKHCFLWLNAEDLFVFTATPQHVFRDSPPLMMPVFSPPSPFLSVLLCVCVILQRSHLHLVYVTHSSFFLYSCSQDPPPCSTSSLTDCWCKEVQLFSLHRPPYPALDLQMRHLTVWFTSPSNAARLLNNSKVKHLTLIHCGAEGSKGTTLLSVEAHFVVQHLERLTVVNPSERPFGVTNRAKSTNSDPERAYGLDKNRFHLDTNMDLIEDTMADSLAASSVQIQDIFLGRELGAAHHEQARLGIINSSVLDWGAMAKAYTVKTQIDSDGALPFPDLHLPKLPETSEIYVSFVYS
ncbi:uncharacterized protein si:ch73-52p7.1 [Oryzias melastigma]|nr:uncharacterized protein si:ch73-52p7.1 [Oryzias melastigma]